MTNLTVLANEKLAGQRRYGKREPFLSSVEAELAYLPTALQDSETVVNLALGDYKERLGDGLMALTDRRVLFLESSGTGAARVNVEDIPIADITGVTTQRGFGGSKLMVDVGRNTARIHNIMPSERSDEIAQYLRQRISGNGSPAPAERSTPAQSDIMMKLKLLGELRDMGVLTEDEFNTKKAELLARI